jgi:hypothetical protein
MTTSSNSRKASSPTLHLLLTEHLLNLVKREIYSRESNAVKAFFNRELRSEITKCRAALEGFDTDSLVAVNNAYAMGSGYSVVPSLTTFGFNEQLTRNHAVFYDILTEHGFSSRNCILALESLGCSSLSLISMKFSPLDIPRARANLRVISHFLRIEEETLSKQSMPISGRSVQVFPASLKKLLRSQPGLAGSVIDFAVHRNLSLAEIDTGIFLEWHASSSKTLSTGIL